MPKPNGLPDNFNERWGALEAHVKLMKEKLDKVEPADITNLKQDMVLLKRVGGTVMAGVIVGLTWAWRRLINGGG